MEIKYLQVLVMDNGEILCLGKTIGYTKAFGKHLYREVKKKSEEEITISKR